MLFNDSVHKYNLKNKATSNLKLYEVLEKIAIDSKVGFYLRDGPLSSNKGIVNLHPSKGTHWVCYKNENYFDSSGCVCPQKLSKFIMKTKFIFFMKRNGHCFYSQNQI